MTFPGVMDRHLKRAFMATLSFLGGVGIKEGTPESARNVIRASSFTAQKSLVYSQVVFSQHLFSLGSGAKGRTENSC